MSLNKKLIVGTLVVGCVFLLLLGLITIDRQPYRQPVKVKYSALVELDGQFDKYIINYNSRNFKSVTNELDKFIEPYTSAELSKKVIDCSEMTPNASQVCLFRSSWLDDCNIENGWCYSKNEPCILLTFVEKSNFVPNLFESLDQIPQNMPKELAQEITYAYEEEHIMIDQVWVFCTNAIDHSPQQGFSERAFSNNLLDNYLRPIVAVQYKVNGSISSECTLWDRRGKISSVEIIITST